MARPRGMSYTRCTPITRDGALRENILHADYQLDTMRLRDFTHTFLFFGVLFDELCRMGMLCRWAESRCGRFCSPYL